MVAFFVIAHKNVSAPVLMATMALELVFGWCAAAARLQLQMAPALCRLRNLSLLCRFVFTVFVLAMPSFAAARLAAPMPNLNLTQSRAVIIMVRPALLCLLCRACLVTSGCHLDAASRRPERRASVRCRQRLLHSPPCSSGGQSAHAALTQHACAQGLLGSVAECAAMQGAQFMMTNILFIFVSGKGKAQTGSLYRLRLYVFAFLVVRQPVPAGLLPGLGHLKSWSLLADAGRQRCMSRLPPGCHEVTRTAVPRDAQSWHARGLTWWPPCAQLLKGVSELVIACILRQHNGPGQLAAPNVQPPYAVTRPDLLVADGGLAAPRPVACNALVPCCCRRALLVVLKHVPASPAQPCMAQAWGTSHCKQHCHRAAWSCSPSSCCQ